MRKLTLSLLVVVFVATLGLGWALDGLFELYSNQPEEDSLLPYREMGVAFARIIDLDDNPKNIVKRLNTESNVFFSLKPEEEFLLPEKIKPAFLAGEALALETGQTLSNRHEVTERISLNFYLPKSRQVLSFTAPGMGAAEVGSPLSLIFTMLFYLGILALLLLWLYPLVKHLIKLRKTAKAFGEGDLSRRVLIESVSYISDIENEFNRMAQRIETLVSDNKLLSSAISHDLRTPLARLRFGVDILAEEIDPATREKYQQRISQDLAEMEALVETFLNYAGMDQAMIELEKCPVNLVEIVESCVKSADKKEKLLNIENRVGNSLVSGDRRYLLMLVNNLLQNAFRHAKTKILVSIESEHNAIILTIEDDGEGIPESEREKVIKPFIRGSKTSCSEGYGMGLAIVKRIADWHDGSLAIQKSTDLGGASICVTLTKATKIS